MTDRLLAGKSALVTGASGALGGHFARTLARAGVKVALGARRIDALRATLERIEADGGEAMAVELDVAAAQSVAGAIETVAATLGGIDVLVNNAGVAVSKPLLEQTEEDWRGVVDVNLSGAWRVAQGVARQMVAAERGGSIINVASILGLRVASQVAGYAASKAGLVQLTRAMALELARHRIRVNALAPGYIETELNRDFLGTEAGQALVKRIPQRRLGQPRELDGALLLLASAASDYITGAVIPVDGGHLCSSL